MPSVSSDLRVSPLTPLFATAAFAASANSIVAAHASTANWSALSRPTYFTKVRSIGLVDASSIGR
jgi:hypothetical protein